MQLEEQGKQKSPDTSRPQKMAGAVFMKRSATRTSTLSDFEGSALSNPYILVKLGRFDL